MNFSIIWQQKTKYISVWDRIDSMRHEMDVLITDAHLNNLKNTHLDQYVATLDDRHAEFALNSPVVCADI